MLLQQYLQVFERQLSKLNIFKIMAKKNTKKVVATKPAVKSSKKSARIQNKATDKEKDTKSKPTPIPKTKTIKKAPVPVAKAKPASKKVKAPVIPAPKSEPKATKAKVVKQKVVKDNTPKGYTKDEFQKYKSQIKRLSDYGNNALKEMLKKNLQSMTGNKEELVAKVADGIVLGRIPRCPKCFGGRPKYDFKKGTYHCSGYRDDEQFKNCHTDYTKQELKRDPWQQ